MIKVAGAKNFGQFRSIRFPPKKKRPISLRNFSYKIVSKILANPLAFEERITSQFQFAFIFDRLSSALTTPASFEVEKSLDS